VPTTNATCFAATSPRWRQPRRPADCDLEWGHAFELASKGSGTRLCYSDTVIDKALPVLAYGEVWQRGGFTCKSEQSVIGILFRTCLQLFFLQIIW
jgi:hypothetical protein